MTIALWAVLFTVTSAEPAASPALVEQGRQAFMQGKFEQALKLLDSALKTENDDATVEKIHLLRGQCFAAKGDFGHTEEAFAQALEANPETSLDPGKIDPALVKLLESIRARLKGHLQLDSTPSGAQVWVDGQEMGVTPLRTTASIGKRRVQVRWGEQREASSEVVVRPKQTSSFHWMLKEHVEKTVEKVAPVAPPETSWFQRFVKPYAAVRLGADLNAGPETGVDLGVGVDFKYLSIGVYFRPYQYVFITPRVLGIWPLTEQLSAFFALEVPMRLHRFGVALGLSVGVEYFFFKPLGVFAEIGGKGFIINEGFVVDLRLSTNLGIRLRLP